jgi:hypothetical protein
VHHTLLLVDRKRLCVQGAGMLNQLEVRHIVLSGTEERRRKKSCN